MRDKLTSRKFWVAVAAALASIGTGITGICTENETLATVGAICLVASAAIYAFAEAYVDGKAAAATITTVSSTSTTSTAVSANTTSATTADKILAGTKVVEREEDVKIGGTA